MAVLEGEELQLFEVSKLEEKIEVTCNDLHGWCVERVSFSYYVTPQDACLKGRYEYSTGALADQCQL